MLDLRPWRREKEEDNDKSSLVAGSLVQDPAKDVGRDRPCAGKREPFD
jgi:hypothetical protein